MRKILIVDDEKIVRSEILRLADWEKYGMEVVGEAENGRAALEFLDSHPVDVMITDLSMPGLSGMEFLQAVREKYPELRIIVMTMHQNFDYIQQAMRLGVVDYITKTRIEKENFGEILEGILKRLSAQSGVRQFQRDTVRFLCRAEGEGTPADAGQALDDGVWLAEDGEVPEGSSASRSSASRGSITGTPCPSSGPSWIRCCSTPTTGASRATSAAMSPSSPPTTSGTFWPRSSRAPSGFWMTPGTRTSAAASPPWP